MIDYRFYTFITLCKTLSYTKTAKIMHITQPAVSQHIIHIEKNYNIKLFNYVNKHLTITDTGEKLYRELISLSTITNAIVENLTQKSTENLNLNFYCTTTVAEYILPNPLCEYIKLYPQANIKMRVNSTTSCINALESANAEFSIIEGQFDKSLYFSKRLKSTRLVPVCCSDHPLLKKDNLVIEDLINEVLILREKNAPSNNILVSSLNQHNLSYDSFNKCIEIGNMNAMKKIIVNGIGIGFIHYDVVKDEINNNELCIIPLTKFNLDREISLIFSSEKLLDKISVFYDLIQQDIEINS